MSCAHKELTVVFINSLSDCAKYLPVAERELHRAFRPLWEQAGTAGRINYCLHNNCSPELVRELETEIENVKRHYTTITPHAASWRDILAAIEKWEAR